MNRTTLLNMTLNEPISYEKLMDVSTEELQLLKEEAEIMIHELRGLLVKQFNEIKPGLQRMQELKQALKSIKEKKETYNTFLCIDKDKNLLSTTSTLQEPVKKVKLSDLFTDIDNDNLLDEEEGPVDTPRPPNSSPVKNVEPPRTPRRGKSPAPLTRNVNTKKTSIPILKK